MMRMCISDLGQSYMWCDCGCVKFWLAAYICQNIMIARFWVLPVPICYGWGGRDMSMTLEGDGEGSHLRNRNRTLKSDF